MGRTVPARRDGLRCSEHRSAGREGNGRTVRRSGECTRRVLPPRRPEPRLAGVGRSLFTDDAEYVDHCLGRFHGREAIAEWIDAGDACPWRCMTFSIEWAMIDGDRAAFWIWNHLPDPAGHRVRLRRSPTWPSLTYAGDGRWSAAEDFASPQSPARRRRRLAGRRGYGRAWRPTTSLAPATPSHPAAARRRRPTGPSLEAVCDALVTENWLDLIETSGADWHDHGGVRILAGPTAIGSSGSDVIHGVDGPVVVLDAPSPAALVAHVNEQGRVTYLDHVYNPHETGRAQLHELRTRAERVARPGGVGLAHLAGRAGEAGRDVRLGDAVAPDARSGGPPCAGGSRPRPARAPERRTLRSRRTTASQSARVRRRKSRSNVVLPLPASGRGPIGSRRRPTRGRETARRRTAARWRPTAIQPPSAVS